MTVVNPLIAWVRQITQSTSQQQQPQHHQQLQHQHHHNHQNPQQHQQQHQQNHQQQGRPPPLHQQPADGSGGIDGRADAQYALERITGIEETLWCPTLGIKVGLGVGGLGVG